MNEKAKVGKPSKQRINRYGFLLMWIIALPLARYVFYLMITNRLLLSLPYPGILNGLYFGIVQGIIIASIQKTALYLHFGSALRGWMRLTISGWIVGGIGLMALPWNLDFPAQWILILQMLTMTLVPTLAQAWILRRQIRSVWLWLLSWGVGATVFSVIYLQNDMNIFNMYAAHGAFAAVTGLSLLWLFGMQASENQSKNIAETSRLEDRSHEISEPERVDESSGFNERESESR